MPKAEGAPSFWDDYGKISSADQERFKEAALRFADDLRAKREPRPGLGIRQMTKIPGVYEFHFSDAGRATFHYGDNSPNGERTIIFRRIGTHAIYKDP